MSENDISNKITGAALDIYKNAVPGLPGPAYEFALAYELNPAKALASLSLQARLTSSGSASLRFPAACRLRHSFSDGARRGKRAQKNRQKRIEDWLCRAPLRSGSSQLAARNFNTKIPKEGIHRLVNDL